MQDILELMQKRYTTKHYDETRRVSDDEKTPGGFALVTVVG